MCREGGWPPTCLLGGVLFSGLDGHPHLSSITVSLLTPRPLPWPQWTREETPQSELPISQVQSPTPGAWALNILPLAVPSKLLNSQAVLLSRVLLSPAHKDGLLRAHVGGLTPQHRVTHTQQGLSEKRPVISQKAPQSLSPRSYQSHRPQLCPVPWQERKCQWPLLPCHHCHYTPSPTAASYKVKEGHS